MERVKELLAVHPFCQGLAPAHLDLLAGCAKERQFGADQFLAREGEEMQEFHLVRSGRVALEIFTARRGPLIIQTRGEGDFLGWLGLAPPAVWAVDIKALEVTRTLALDLSCLGAFLERDHELGFELLRRFTRGMAGHFTSMKRQLVNIIHGL